MRVSSSVIVVALMGVVAVVDGLTCYTTPSKNATHCASESLAPKDGLPPVCYSYTDCDTEPNQCILTIGAADNVTFVELSNRPEWYRGLQGCPTDFCIPCPVPQVPPPTSDGNNTNGQSILFTGLINLDQDAIHSNQRIAGTIVGVLCGFVSISVFASIWFE